MSGAAYAGMGLDTVKSKVGRLRISEFALAFFIFSTVMFNEGASISVASKLLLFVVTAFECVRSRRMALNGFVVAAFIFLCYSIASLAWSQVPVESLARVKTLLFQFVCYTCVAILVGEDKQTMKVCLATFVVSALASSIYVIGVNGVTFQDNRYSDGVVSSGQLALTAVFSMMLCILWHHKTKQARFWVLFIAFAIVLLLTSSRRDLIIICVFAVLFYAASSNDIRNKLGAILVGAVICALLLFLLLNVDFLYQFVGRRLETFLDFILFGTGGDASTTGRSRLIDYGMELFHDSPVLGNGVGTFESLFSLTHGSWQTSADNNYVELFADLGIVGFACYYIPLAIFLIHGLKDLTRKSIEVRFGVVGIISFCAIDFACVWFFSKCGMLMILFLYLLTRQYKDIDEDCRSTKTVMKSA